MQLNIVINPHDKKYADYMQFYRDDMVNIFIGYRASGKTWSIIKWFNENCTKVSETVTEYEVKDDMFIKYVHNCNSIHQVSMPKGRVKSVTLKNGIIFTATPEYNEQLVKMFAHHDIKYITEIH